MEQIKMKLFLGDNKFILVPYFIWEKVSKVLKSWTKSLKAELDWQCSHRSEGYFFSPGLLNNRPIINKNSNDILILQNNHKQYNKHSQWQALLPWNK